MYTIQDLSKEFNLNASALRYYEEAGLLTNVGRTKSGLRIYEESHRIRLNAISCFKRTGLPISKMLEFFNYEESLTDHIDEIRDMMIQHQDYLTGQIAGLTEDLKHIEKKVRYYTAIKNALGNGLPFPDWENV